jgi:hypothetical protein
MDPTPFEQVVVAVAEKFAGELTVLLLTGAVTNTPALPVIVIVMDAVAAPPQWSHCSTTVL